MEFIWTVDILIELMVRMDPCTLISFAQVDRFTYSIHQDDWFWRTRVEHDFGLDVAQNRPLKITHRTQYMDLIKPDDLEIAVILGRLDLVIHLTRGAETIQIDPYWVNQAVGNGHLEILEWLNYHRIYPTQPGVNRAALNGRLKILQWLRPLGLLPNLNGANSAAYKNHLDLLMWLGGFGIYPDQYGANLAAREGHLKLLKWLCEQGVLPDRKGAGEAAGNGHLETVEWLISRGILPDDVGVNWAIHNDQFEVIDHLIGIRL